MIVELFRTGVLPPVTSLSQQPCVNIIHCEDQSVDTDVPTLCLQLSFHLELMLPYFVAVIYLTCCIVVFFCSLWLFYLECYMFRFRIWFLTYLPQTRTLVRRSLLERRTGCNKITPLPVKPHKCNPCFFTSCCVFCKHTLVISSSLEFDA